jgi:N6-adenosine-specific RNA methylase IME4
VTVDIETLVLLDKRIDENECDAVRARWEFGREMLAMRDESGRLPHKRLVELVKVTGKSRTELKYRAQFAEQYSEQKVANALATFTAWRELTKSLKAENDAAENAPTTPTPAIEGKYRTIVADPPWHYDNAASRGAANNHYKTMTIEQLCAMDIADHAEPNAHLYMWTTSAHLPHAFDVMSAWGFQYKTYLVWVKPQIGMGNYFRTCTELIMFGVRGTMRTQTRDTRNWFESPRQRHSAKPPQFHQLVMAASPGEYLELFTRCRKPHDCQCSKCRYGWATYGDQA